MVLVIRYLFILKSDVYTWASALKQLRRDPGFTLCRAYGDVWMGVFVNTLELVAITDYSLPAVEP